MSTPVSICKRTSPKIVAKSPGSRKSFPGAALSRCVRSLRPRARTRCLWTLRLFGRYRRAWMASAGAAISFCPTSNLFLGSGLFDVGAARAPGVRVGLGTDIGGGTSLSMLRTQAEAYKIVQLAGGRLAPLSTLYHATLGGARSLYLDDPDRQFRTRQGRRFSGDRSCRHTVARAPNLARRHVAGALVRLDGPGR